MLCVDASECEEVGRCCISGKCDSLMGINVSGADQNFVQLLCYSDV